MAQLIGVLKEISNNLFLIFGLILPILQFIQQFRIRRDYDGDITARLELECVRFYHVFSKENGPAYQVHSAELLKDCQDVRLFDKNEIVCVGEKSTFQVFNIMLRQPTILYCCSYVNNAYLLNFHSSQTPTLICELAETVYELPTPKIDLYLLLIMVLHSPHDFLRVPTFHQQNVRNF